MARGTSRRQLLWGATSFGALWSVGCAPAAMTPDGTVPDEPDCLDPFAGGTFLEEVPFSDEPEQDYGTLQEQGWDARRVFDLSRLDTGAEVVASRVRFRGGLPDRAGYRRYKVKGVEGQDDFASMKEVVGRSLKRGMDEEDLPDLIVVDGGAAQLGKALEARDEAGVWDLPIVGLAKARPERTVDGKRKGRTEERLYLAPDKEPTILPRHDAGRLLLERLRDEAHRFAITFHRQRRGKIQSRLDAIPGVGEAKRKALLRAFGSAEGVKQASVEQLAALPSIGSKLARVISDHLHGRAK